MKLKLTKVGNSLGIVLPKEACDRMKLGPGDAVYLTDRPDGYRITPYHPEFAEQMDAARRIGKKRRSVLRDIAK